MFSKSLTRLLFVVVFGLAVCCFGQGLIQFFLAEPFALNRSVLVNFTAQSTLEFRGKAVRIYAEISGPFYKHHPNSWDEEYYFYKFVHYYQNSTHNDDDYPSGETVPEGPGYHAFPHIDVFDRDRTYTRLGLRWRGRRDWKSEKTTYQAVGEFALAGDGDPYDRPVNIVFKPFKCTMEANYNFSFNPKDYEQAKEIETTLEWTYSAKESGTCPCNNWTVVFYKEGKSEVYKRIKVDCPDISLPNPGVTVKLNTRESDCGTECLKPNVNYTYRLIQETRDEYYKEGAKKFESEPYNICFHSLLNKTVNNLNKIYIPKSETKTLSFEWEPFESNFVCGTKYNPTLALSVGGDTKIGTASLSSGTVDVRVGTKGEPITYVLPYLGPTLNDISKYGQRLSLCVFEWKKKESPTCPKKGEMQGNSYSDDNVVVSWDYKFKAKDGCGKNKKIRVVLYYAVASYPDTSSVQRQMKSEKFDQIDGTKSVPFTFKKEDFRDYFGSLGATVAVQSAKIYVEDSPVPALESSDQAFTFYFCDVTPPAAVDKSTFKLLEGKACPRTENNVTVTIDWGDVYQGSGCKNEVDFYYEVSVPGHESQKVNQSSITFTEHDCSEDERTITVRACKNGCSDFVSWTYKHCLDSSPDEPKIIEPQGDNMYRIVDSQFYMDWEGIKWNTCFDISSELLEISINAQIDGEESVEHQISGDVTSTWVPMPPHNNGIYDGTINLTALRGRTYVNSTSKRTKFCFVVLPELFIHSSVDSTKNELNLMISDKSTLGYSCGETIMYDFHIIVDGDYQMVRQSETQTSIQLSDTTEHVDWWVTTQIIVPGRVYDISSAVDTYYHDKSVSGNISINSFEIEGGTPQGLFKDVGVSFTWNISTWGNPASSGTSGSTTERSVYICNKTDECDSESSLIPNSSSKSRASTKSIGYGNHELTLHVKNGNLVESSGVLSICLFQPAPEVIPTCPSLPLIFNDNNVFEWKLSEKDKDWKLYCLKKEDVSVNVTLLSNTTSSIEVFTVNLTDDKFMESVTVGKLSRGNYTMWVTSFVGDTMKKSRECSVEVCEPKPPPKFTSKTCDCDSDLGACNFEWIHKWDTVEQDSCLRNKNAWYNVRVSRTSDNVLVFERNLTGVKRSSATLVSGSYSWYITTGDMFHSISSELEKFDLCVNEVQQPPSIEMPNGNYVIDNQTEEVIFKFDLHAIHECLIPSYRAVIYHNGTSIYSSDLTSGQSSFTVSIDEFNDTSDESYYTWVIEAYVNWTLEKSTNASFSFCTPVMDAIELKYPNDDNVVPALDGRVDFQWAHNITKSCSMDIVYILTISEDPGQSKIVRRVTTDGNRVYGIKLEDKRTYWWSVVPSHSLLDLTSYSSDVYNFTVCLETRPDTPVSQYPENGGLVRRDDFIGFLFYETDFGLSCSGLCSDCIDNDYDYDYDYQNSSNETNSSSESNYKNYTEPDYEDSGYYVNVYSKAGQEQEIYCTPSPSNVVMHEGGRFVRVIPNISLSYGENWWHVYSQNRAGHQSLKVDRRYFYVWGSPRAPTFSGPMNASGVSSNMTFRWVGGVDEFGYAKSGTGYYKVEFYLEDMGELGNTTTTIDEPTHLIHEYKDSVPPTNYEIKWNDIKHYVKGNHSYIWKVVFRIGDSDIEVNETSVYSFTTDTLDCKYVTCMNGGECDEKTKWSCVCPSNYTGQYCETYYVNKRPWIIAGCVGGGIFLIAIIVTLILIMRRKNNSRSKIVLAAPGGDLRFSNLVGSPVSLGGDERETLLSMLKRDGEENYFAWTLKALSSIQSSALDNMTKAFVYVYEYLGMSKEFMKAVISSEVNEMSDSSTIFRGNTAATMSFKIYARMIGISYLFDVLSPTIRGIMQKFSDDRATEEQIENAAEFSDVMTTKDTFEVDPSKLGEDADDGVLEVNNLQLTLNTQRFINSIIRSVKTIPMDLCDVITHINICVQHKFPDAVVQADSAFIFLRFYNPAISLPESYGLLPSPPDMEVRRSLVLITKVLSTISSGATFKKEEFMMQFNTMAEEYFPKIDKFYAKISERSVSNQNPNQPHDFQVPSKLLNDCLSVISQRSKEMLSQE